MVLKATVMPESRRIFEAEDSDFGGGAHDGTVYAGTELSAIYRSEDRGETWNPPHTLMT
jgi:hypothetical protein